MTRSNEKETTEEFLTAPQGTWESEGDTLRGKFTRKDNSKVLTTTRALVEGELVQVSKGPQRCTEVMQISLSVYNLRLLPADIQLRGSGCKEDFQEALTQRM